MLCWMETSSLSEQQGIFKVLGIQVVADLVFKTLQGIFKGSLRHCSFVRASSAPLKTFPIVLQKMSKQGVICAQS